MPLGKVLTSPTLGIEVPLAAAFGSEIPIEEEVEPKELSVM
jgi:hypothetical protein